MNFDHKLTLDSAPAEHFYDAVTHLVHNGPYTDELEEAKKERKDLKIVKTSWLDACEKEGKKVMF